MWPTLPPNYVSAESVGLMPSLAKYCLEILNTLMFKILTKTFQAIHLALFGQVSFQLQLGALASPTLTFNQEAGPLSI